MTDIVERLRKWAKVGMPVSSMNALPGDCLEAADEIERLRAQRTFESRMDDAWRSGYRNAVLEEAAKFCAEGNELAHGNYFAAGIRALKGGGS
jgi:hypothetical protein